MGSCSCSCFGANEKVDKDAKFTKGSADDCSNGPVKNRRCTDITCCGLYIAHWVLFVIVTMAGFSAGDPSKLYLPRDYRGSYCGSATNWNDGPNLETATKLTYMMNTTSTTDLIAKQMLCSSAANSALGGLVAPGLSWNASMYDDYLCACCLTPCASCVGSLDVGGDLSSADMGSTISGKMTDLTNPSKGGDLFSPSGANGDAFSNMWSEATKYFVQVCLPSCTVDASTVASLNATNGSNDTLRNFTYTPDGDNPLLPAWNKLTGDGPAFLKDTIQNSFVFTALPLSTCNYDARYCVPFPGVAFKEVTMNYCTFEMADQVVGAIGDSAASAMSGLGADNAASSASSSFGSNVGDFIDSIDTFILVGFASFVVGILFMVFLRLCIGVCVWLSILMVFLAFVFGGALCYVRSNQCAGASIFSTGQEAAVGAAVMAQNSAANAAAGVEGPSEELIGDGGNYTGVQMRTKSGKLCQAWSSQTPHSHAYTAANFPHANLTDNYCRNPYNYWDKYKSTTIWCLTTDSQQVWEQCYPIGVMFSECKQGYAVANATWRDILKYCSYVIWAFAGLWFLLVLFMYSRIKMAIALNKVAAQFVMHNPFILTVPVTQAFIGLTWCLVWAFCASFLLSQVPDGYVETGYISTYAEAYGIDAAGWMEEGTPGVCTGKWPQGSVWKDSECLDGKCWRCAPPRYVMDVRFAFSFFSFLWNNAFLIAAGQCIVAGAVGAWFFTPNKDKGKSGTTKIGVKNVFRYHLGSVAFGSLILAIVQFIRYFFKYLEKQASAQKNRVMVYIFKCVQCCIWCFEQCIKFLNKNAYIQIALLGTPFCTSAKKAAFLVARNFLRFAAVLAMSGLISSIGFVCMTVGTAVIGYLLLNAMHPEISPLFPVFVYTCVGYVVGKLYLNVFGLAVDTSLQCIIAAEEMDMAEGIVPGALSDFIKVKENPKKDEVQAWVS